MWEKKFAGVAFFFAGFAVAQRRKKFAGLAPQAKFLLFLLDMPSRSDGKILLGWRRLAPQPNFAEQNGNKKYFWEVSIDNCSRRRGAPPAKIFSKFAFCWVVQNYHDVAQFC